VGEFLEPARREVPRADRRECIHPAARLPLSYLTGQVVGPRKEARVVDGVAVVAAVPQVSAAPLAVATRAVALVEPAQVVVEEPAREAVGAATTNPQLPFVA
jgi:hypothetical protein